MKNSSRLIAPMVAASVLASLPLVAQSVTYNFDDDVNPFDAGTISTDQAVSGTKSLELTGDVFATWNLPPEFLNTSLQITMSVFDAGRYRDDTDYNKGNGPRWGAGHSTGANEYVAVGINDNSFLDSATAYGRNGTDSFLGDFSRNQWFGPQYMGNRGSAHLSASPNTTTPGTGTWTSWTFDIDSAGDAIFSGTGSADRSFAIGQSASAVYLFGGDANGGGTMAGMYVDDITVTVIPEPSTLALVFGAGALALVASRRLRR